MMRKALLTGLMVLVAGLIVPALAFAYTNRAASSEPTPVVALADDDADEEARPWVGVALAQLNEKLAERLEIGATEGVVVINVVKESPAEAAGLERGDIVLQVGDETVETVKDAVDAVRASSPGDTLTFTVLRGSEELTVDVEVGERPGKVHRNRGHRGVPGFLKLLAPMAGNLLRADITVQDQDGNPVNFTYVAGVVSEIDGTALTVTPKDGGADLALNVEGTPIIKGGHEVEAADLAVDDEVIVVTKDGETVVVLVKPFHGRQQGGGFGKHGGFAVTGEMELQRGPSGGGPGLGLGPMLRGQLQDLQDQYRGSFRQRLPNFSDHYSEDRLERGFLEEFNDEGDRESQERLGDQDIRMLRERLSRFLSG